MQIKARPSILKDRSGFNPDSSGFEDWKVKNPKLWKQIKKKLDKGRSTYLCQMYNCIENSHARTLRMFLHDFNDRYLSYGPGMFPTSFNVLEPFMNFNIETSILELLFEEEEYSLSLEDFLEEITSKDFDFDSYDLYNEIPEDLIYHFEFSSGVVEYPIVCENGKEFHIGHVSVVRRNNIVSVILNCGVSFDENDKMIVQEMHSKANLESNMTPFKKELGLKIDPKEDAKIFTYLEDNLWRQLLVVVFDIDSKTIDTRYYAKDCHTVYESLTDDLGILVTEKGGKMSETAKEDYIMYLKKFEEIRNLTEFAKFAMFLPKYTFDREVDLISIDYPTSLSRVISGPISRRKYRDVPQEVKIFAKPVYFLKSKLTTIKKMDSVKDSSFKIEKSGYWKRLKPDEKGIDKKGKQIIGKTWVDRHETYYKEKDGRINIKPTIKYEGDDAGIIYIMRDPEKPKGVFKVGLSTRNSEIRRRELSNTSIIDHFYVMHEYNTKDCKLAESLIHKELSDYRVTERREFFSCDLNHIMLVCERVVDEVNKKIRPTR